MTALTSSVAFLCEPRSRFVQLEAGVKILADGSAMVGSLHTINSTEIYRNFSMIWTNPHEAATEYGCGLSVIHDIKDHYFYGLGITDLTEFQTIVQTYYGREAAGGSANRAARGDYVERIKQAVHDELYGPRGSRVYDPSAKGLLDQYCSDASEAERHELYLHMLRICFEIMLPELQAVYAGNALVRQLQASTLDQPSLVDYYLRDVVWSEARSRILRLIDNDGLRVAVRAYVDDDLALASERIYRNIRAYVKEHGLNVSHPKLFKTAGYLITKRLS